MITNIQQIGCFFCQVERKEPENRPIGCFFPQNNKIYIKKTGPTYPNKNFILRQSNNIIFWRPKPGPRIEIRLWDNELHFISGLENSLCSPAVNAGELFEYGPARSSGTRALTIIYVIHVKMAHEKSTLCGMSFTWKRYMEN